MLAARTNRPILTYDARGMGNSTRLQQGNERTSLELSMEIMALDALSVARRYHQFKDDSEQKDFCVGGVSMGGMVAQTLAHILHHDHDDYDERVSSLGLIASSPIRRRRFHTMPSSFPSINLPEEHFLSSFDNWHSLDEENKHRSAKTFFRALGPGFLAKPGRKALRDRLIASFLSTRNNFVNGIGCDGIMAQRHVLLNESHGLLGDDHVADKGSWYEPLVGLNIPSVIVHGEEDSVISLSHGKKLHSIMKSIDGNCLSEGQDESRGAELVVIKDCDHLCWITHGHELVNTMGEFWSRNGPK